MRQDNKFFTRVLKQQELYRLSQRIDDLLTFKQSAKVRNMREGSLRYDILIECVRQVTNRPEVLDLCNELLDVLETPVMSREEYEQYRALRDFAS